ncbi:hypothetical protein Agabi119p4_805 [Agaricus bisporus var. burnettii]|uniref:WD40 repeat-like protein n=1 Tax=Agaricus bisporus var. burnettii TaxID=192524 RepID=A0A8H7FBL3_AGABI|nr:hypothetical protein Agabi119p4_805 [Agaricus bisporus var. burnettii]
MDTTGAQPWYRDPSSDLPFELYSQFRLEGLHQDALRTVAFFPWGNESLGSLWDGSLATEQNYAKWNVVVNKFRDTVAIGGDTSVYILWLKRRKHPLRINIPETPEVDLIHSDTTQVAWVLSPNAIDQPLLILSRASLIWIYNPVSKGLSSYLRGHGGAITSLAVHPTRPHLFCSTSRDHSARIYDLNLAPHQGAKDSDVNPHWPPGTLPSRAGAPHGLHMNEAEGFGIARCIIVLMGGRSGGHEAAVLSASFHPQYPIIATCGVDRCIKLWHVNPRNSSQITREDKPLFSSSRIHRSRVLSVQWMSHDTLISHNPSAILRTDPTDEDNKDTYMVPGEIVVWTWLGLDRFFPPLYDDLKAEGRSQTVLRGCASDYQESSSFTMSANAAFPAIYPQLISPNVNVYQSPTHDPIALCTIPTVLPFEKKKEEHQKDKGAICVSDIHGDRSLSSLSVENLATGTPKDGETRVAGTVQIFHIPSLPHRLPSRFPLDAPPDGMPANAKVAEEGIADLPGLSRYHAELIERDPPPPFKSWTLEVPLSEFDLTSEATHAVGHGPAGGMTQAYDTRQRKVRSEKDETEKITGQEYTLKSIAEVPVSVQNAKMGMDGKVIVVLGTRGRLWVYRIQGRSRHQK